MTKYTLVKLRLSELIQNTIGRTSWWNLLVDRNLKHYTTSLWAGDSLFVSFFLAPMSSYEGALAQALGKTKSNRLWAYKFSPNSDNKIWFHFHLGKSHSFMTLLTRECHVNHQCQNDLNLSSPVNGNFQSSNVILGYNFYKIYFRNTTLIYTYLWAPKSER